MNPPSTPDLDERAETPEPAASPKREDSRKPQSGFGEFAADPEGFGEFAVETKLQAMTALHGARRTPPGLRPALVTHLLNAGLVAYTDIGWTITAAGYRRLAAAEGTPRGAAYARSLVDQTARVREVEDRNRLMSREGAA